MGKPKPKVVKQQESPQSICDVPWWDRGDTVKQHEDAILNAKKQAESMAAEERRLNAEALAAALATKTKIARTTRRSECPGCGKLDSLVKKTLQKGAIEKQYLICQSCGKHWNRPKPK